MKLRSLGLIVTLALALLAVPLVAQAQQPGKVYRIGYLGITASTEVDAFLDALRELGYVEDRNLVIERRFSEGREDQFPGLVAEVLQRNVDVIVAASTAAARAAKAATSTVPIELGGILDPEKTGLVASLARPGGNITGVSNHIADIQSKLMELLREVVPRAKRLGVLWNPDNPGSVVSWEGQKPRAAALGLTLISGEIRRPADVEPALTQVARQRPDALHLYLVLLPYRAQIIDFALRHRLPTLVGSKIFAEAGALMSYGAPTDWKSGRRVATYVDRILRGANPADLPVEQPTTFELVINMRTAKALGLTLPRSLLLRADQLIE